MDELESKVVKIIGEQLGKNEADIKLDSNFVDDLEADSLDTVELVMALEEEFGILRHSLQGLINELFVVVSELFAGFNLTDVVFFLE